MKCFYCILEYSREKLKWSAVADAIVVIHGKSMCYKHISTHEAQNALVKK